MATVTSAMDADFLKRTVGRPLSEALTSLVIAQPTDPIEFIGEALLDYIKRREDETTRSKHAVEVAHLLELSREQQEILDKEKIVQEEAVQATVTVEQDVEAAISQASRHADVYSKVINFVRGRLAASGVQLGRKVVIDGQEIVEFIAASAGREDMVGQELKGLKDGEDAEEGASEEGVTFNLWKKTEMPPPPEPVFDEEGELIPDENEPELIPPEHLLIENVVRDARVKFFGIPKLGSYLAVPVTYGSWLHPGGISDAPPPAQDETPGEEEDQDGAGEDAEEKDAGGAVEADEDKPKAPVSPYSKNEAPVHLVMCVDTMGQGRCFSASDVEWVKAWAAKLKVTVEALEARMFDEEAALLPSLRGREAIGLIAKVAEGEEAAVEEALAALEAGTPEEDKERLTKATKYRHKTKAVEAVRELVGLMGKLSLAPPAGVLSVLERALLLVGKNKTDMCDARGALDWAAKMRTLVSTELVPAILAFDAESETSAALAADAKEAIESIEAEGVKATNIPALAILDWMSSAITEVEDAVAAAAAKIAAEEAAAEAAAAASAEAAEAAALAEEEDGEGGDD